jgi:hypothetical protein
MSKITTPSEHRSFLLSAMEAVAEGRINVSQANAIVGISGEFHKSIRQEWDMRVYAEENITIKGGKVIKMLE